MRLKREFFIRDVLVVAPELVGKIIGICRGNPPVVAHAMITEVEAYRGEEDLACHARFGKTKRNAVMYEPGGLLYVYLVYGLHWMLNIVTGPINEPQAVLIRGMRIFTPGVGAAFTPGVEIDGPGKVTQYLGVDKSFYGEDLTQSHRIWVASNAISYKGTLSQTYRIGVNYAGEWARKPWRWVYCATP